MMPLLLCGNNHRSKSEDRFREHWPTHVPSQPTGEELQDYCLDQSTQLQAFQLQYNVLYVIDAEFEC